MRCWQCFAVVALLLSCESPSAQPVDGQPVDDEPQRVSVVDHAQWMMLTKQADPLASHRPPTVDCPDAAWGLEAASLEVQTGVCNYFAVGQQLTTGLESGDELIAELWFQDLDSPEPARAHVALLLDDEVLAEQTVSIPHMADVLTLKGAITKPHPPGSTVSLHLHNHGFNSWTFVDVVHVY